MIIGRGHNMTETLHERYSPRRDAGHHRRQKEYLGGKYLDKCTLYVTVEPCIMCAGAIGWSQCGRIVYGASDPKRGYQTYAPKAFHPKANVTSGVLEDECGQLMKEFFKSKR